MVMQSSKLKGALEGVMLARSLAKVPVPFNATVLVTAGTPFAIIVWKSVPPAAVSK